MIKLSVSPDPVRRRRAAAPRRSAPVRDHRPRYLGVARRPDARRAARGLAGGEFVAGRRHRKTPGCWNERASRVRLTHRHLIARHAESALWLARYMERIENLARLLDVTKTFARDADDTRNWLSLLRINGDAEGFFAKHADGRSHQRGAVLSAGRREPDLGAVRHRRGAGECPHPARADLHRDVAADQRVPRPHPRADAHATCARRDFRRLRAC